MRMPAPAFAVASLVGAALTAPAELRDWGVERTSYLDPVTGIRIHEQTGRNSRADNLYFHVSNFTADNRHLLFVSDRTGSWQLYKAEVASGRITQLTDDPRVNPRSTCPHPRDPARAFVLRGPTVLDLDLTSGSTCEIGTIPEPRIGGYQQPTLSHDGDWLTTTKQVNDAEWEIGLMHIATGEYRTVTRQGFRIGHVQHCPTAPLIFYVWETGGYAPQRTWLVQPDGSRNRPFYASTTPANWITPLKEWVTHEAWVPTGTHMTMILDKVGVLLVAPDGTWRLVREGHYWHAAASPDGRQLVLDDMQGRLWLCDVATGNVRLLATGVRGVERVHAHPSFDRNGDFIQFHTARTHETVALIHLGDVPPID